MQRDRGFTLLELLMVATLIMIISAIAIPGLLRARLSGNEASAIGSLRAIVDGQGLFAASCGGGYFAPTLVLLGTPPAAGGDGFVGPDLAGDPIVKSTYTIALTVGPPAPASQASCNGGAAGSLPLTYFAAANPSSTGSRFFGVNQSATVYESGAAVVVTQSGAPAGAAPIQ